MQFPEIKIPDIKLPSREVQSGAITGGGITLLVILLGWMGVNLNAGVSAFAVTVASLAASYLIKGKK